jgi:hypothetical protein
MGLTLEQLIDRTGVSEAFVHRLIELGAFERPEGPYGERELHVVALLHRWEGAGLHLSPSSRRSSGDLSLTFLDTPGLELTGRLDRTYRAFAEATGVPLGLVLGLHEAIGFARPDPGDRIREDDPTLVEVARAFMEGGASEAAILRMFRVYGITSAGWLRRKPTSTASRSSSGSGQKESLTRTSWSTGPGWGGGSAR